MKPNVHSSRILHKGFLELREDLLQRPDGLTHPYTTLLLGADAAVVLAQDTSGQWVLNREYRHPTRDYLIGCPGGRLEPGEDPLEGGKREFFEETGYLADDLALLGCCHPFPALCDQKIYFIHAKRAIKKGEQKLDKFEFIETVLMSDAQLREAIKNGLAVDGVLCTALLYYGLKSIQSID
jgi:ADP-ribose pyrophosphatase